MNFPALGVTGAWLRAAAVTITVAGAEDDVAEDAAVVIIREDYGETCIAIVYALFYLTGQGTSGLEPCDVKRTAAAHRWAHGRGTGKPRPKPRRAVLSV